MIFFVALTLSLVVALPCAGRAATVFHSPLNDGVEGSSVTIPETSTPVAINVWLRPTPPSPVASAAGQRCAGTADPNTAGDEICMWDVHIVGTGDLVFDGFTPAAGVIAAIDSGGSDPILRANGGDPVDPNAPPGAQPIGVLNVSAPPGGTGEVQVTGNLWVSTLLAAAPVDGTPGGAPLGAVPESDADGDGVPDASDNCPYVANAGQAASTQSGFEAIGCACLCGDVNLDCTIDSGDALEIKLAAGFAPPQVTYDPDHCDVNGDGGCNSADALEILLFSGSAPPQLDFSPTNCAFNQAP